MPFALGKSGRELLCATGLWVHYLHVADSSPEWLKGYRTCLGKGSVGVRVAAGVPVSQDLATGCMTDTFLSYQHCHGNCHSEIFYFLETKFSVLMLR